MLVSKKTENFFPHLSETVYNDTILLPIIMPFSDAKIYAKYAYHNSKYSSFETIENPRNERRLYLNKKLDQDKFYFKETDIVVFEKVESFENNVLGLLYFITIFTNGSSNYDILDNIILNSKIKGGHALYYDELDFIPNPCASLDQEREAVIPDEIIKVVHEQQKEILSTVYIEEEESQTDIEIEEIRGAHLFNSFSFRDFVLNAYGYKCAISGESITHKNLHNLEAAHIQPKAHSGTFLPCNGIALSRDMHWAFDKGFISITDDFEILVHDEMKDSILKKIDGQKIKLPKDTYFQPEKKFLKHHREQIFGLFLSSGSIRSKSTC